MRLSMHLKERLSFSLRVKRRRRLERDLTTTGFEIRGFKAILHRS